MSDSTELLQEDRTFRLLADAARDYAIIVLDDEGRIASWNPGAERMHGFSAAEAIGRPFALLYPRDDRRRERPREHLRLAEEHGSYEAEGWQMRKNGRRFSAHVTITALREADAELLGFGIITRDLTQQRQAEQQLRETADRFHELAAHVQEVFWITSSDMQQVLYVSPAFERVWGQAVATAYEGAQAWMRAAHPDDRSLVEAAVPQWTAGEYALEYRIVRPDGAVRWIRARGVPVRDEQGLVERVVGIAEDITERKEREDELGYLAEAGRILTSSLDYEETLARVARLAVPEIADWCAVYVAEGDELRLVEVAHRDAEKVAAAWEFRRRYPPDPAAPTGAYRVLLTGEPELLPEISDSLIKAAAPDADFVRLLGRLGLRSAMTVPMSARGRTLGVISFVAAESGRQYGPQDLAFAETLAGRAALAIDNARLHREVEGARQRATNILESITDAFIAIDRDWRLTYLNPGARAVILGAASRDPGEATGRVLWDVVPGLETTRFAAEYRAAMAEQKEKHFEAIFGDWNRWFEVHVYPSVEGLSIFFQDVTTRKEAEQERERLLRRERFLAEATRIFASSLDYEATLESVARLAVPALADYCLVDVLEDDGRLRRVATAHVNREKEQLLRLAQRHPPGPESKSPALHVLRPGKSILMQDVTTEWLAALSQSPEHAEVMEALGPRSAILVPLSVREQMLGVLWLVRSESAERYTKQDLATAEELAARAATALDNARLYRAIDAARGEAERRAREEAALRDAAEAVSASFTVGDVVQQISSSAVTATNSDGAFIQRIDPEAEEVEVVAVGGEIVPGVGSRLPYEGSYVEQVIERKESEVIRSLAESDRPLPDGLPERYPDCSALIIPLVDGGEPIGALTLVRLPERCFFRADEAQRALTFGDLAALAFRKVHILEESERRREELERVTESRARLMRGFSHDLKNPLGAADGLLQLMEEGVLNGNDSPAKEGLGRARRAIQSAFRLIDDLLELARAEAGQVEIRLGATDLREAAEQLTEEYRAQAEAEGLQLNVEMPQEFPLITSDLARVRQILGNLLSNAVKYTPSGGTVTVRAEEREHPEQRTPWVTVAVRDTGPGIPEDQRKVLFREFTRLETGGEKAGAGIGLAISKRLAHALGGDIMLESEVGRGSTFTLWLPQERDDG